MSASQPLKNDPEQPDGASSDSAKEHKRAQELLETARDTHASLHHTFATIRQVLTES